MEIDKSLREENVQSLSLSISIVFLIFILMSSTFNSFIIKPLLRDGSLIVHGRYMITFDALDTVEADEGASVVAIGSSITRASIDGSCISSQFNLTRLPSFCCLVTQLFRYSVLFKLYIAPNTIAEPNYCANKYGE